ncbi:somatostatin receptor type 4-like [Hydractinia symbiolongicarpus]|uniref:somatostatin receptor type 4-like n=1 Tax=Hydractinia symbiolongicarpus TaxID=13093 RepID=UPI00254DE890|nr:somatostatin receptor type 4-like [Hydractinia symbiolongicarpus]
MENRSLESNTTIRSSLDIFESDAVNITLKSLYVIIVAPAIAVNCLILYLLITKRIKSSNFTLLLYHLVTANTISGISVLPYVFIDVHKLTIRNDIEGTVVCWSTIGLCFFYATGANQVFFVCFISVFRLFKIKWRRQASQYFTKQNIQKLSIFAWIASMSAMIPNITSWTYRTEYGYCKRNWSSPVLGTVYTCSNFLIGLLIPSIVFVVCYVLIKKALKKHKNNLAIANSRVVRSSRKITNLLRILFLSFTLCWAPLLIYFFLATVTSVFPNSVKGDRIRLKFIRVSVLVAVTNILLNPLFLFFHLKEHREALKVLFRIKQIETSQEDGVTIETIQSI